MKDSDYLDSLKLPSLHRAAASGDHDAIDRLLAAGDEINAVVRIPHARGGQGVIASTPLVLAAGSEWGATADTVQRLLDAGASPEPAAPHESAAVAATMGWHGRFWRGDAARLKLILAAGAPLPVDGEPMARLVSHAAQMANAECLQLLLEAGLSPDPLTDVAEFQQQSKSFFRTLIGSLPPRLGKSVERLLGDSDEPTPPGPYSFLCPLHSAALGGSAECVRILIDAGADLDAVNFDNRKAVSEAMTVEALRVFESARPGLGGEGDVEELLEVLEENDDPPVDREEIRAVIRERHALGVPLVIVDEDGDDDILSHFAFRRNLAACEILIELGAPVVKLGWTALHGLAWQDDVCPDGEIDFVKFVQLLLAAGIPVDARDDRGNTPLHEAVAGDGPNLSVSHELLRAGADVNARNNEGQTPLHHLYEVAFGYQDGKTIPALLNAGANPTLRDQSGVSALAAARSISKGSEPAWRAKRAKEKELPCGWKSPAEKESPEWEALQMIEAAAKKFGGE